MYGRSGPSRIVTRHNRPVARDSLTRSNGAAPFSVIARLWWLATRRLWRQNTILPFAFAGLAFTVVVDLARTPAVNGGAYLSLLTVAALLTALLAPILFHAGSVLDSRRFEILPLRPFVVLLARPVFGNSFRLLLTIFVLFACGTAIAHLPLPPDQTALEVLKLLGWVLSGLAVVVIFEEILRRGSSILMYAVKLLLLAFSLPVLAAPRTVRVLLRSGSFPKLHGPLSSVLIGSDAGVRWEVAAALAPFLLFVALVAIGKAVTEKFRALPPRTGQTKAWVRPIRAVARLVAPRATASFGKELGLLIRVRAFWIGYVYFFAVSAAAFSAKTPSLFAIAFLFWIAAGYNTLGPDVPMGGLLRYDLMPRVLKRTLTMRHAAVLAVSAVTAAAAFGFVALVGSVGGSERRSVETSPSAYVTWLLYGASLFLLSTIMGDWVSAREPRPIGLRSVVQGRVGAGTAASGLVGFVALAGTVATSGILIVGAAMTLGALGANTDEPGNFLLAVLVASLVQIGLYAYRYTRSR